MEITSMQITIIFSALIISIAILIGMLIFNKRKNRVDKSIVNKTKVKEAHKVESKEVQHVEKKIKKPNVEFSKKILYVTFAIAIVIISFAMVIIYMGTVSGHGADSSNLNTLLGGLFAEITAGTSFYYWKSRRENEIKLEATYGKRIHSDDEN